MHRSLLAGALALGVVVSGLPLACGQPFTLVAAGSDGGPEAQVPADGSMGDDSSSGGGDDGSNDGPNPLGDGHVGVRDAQPEGASLGHIVFVSPAGNDNNDGLLPGMPKKTIVGGLARAVLLGSGAEVHVCAGSYSEKSLVMNLSIPLYGSYDCTSWQRSSPFVYPGFTSTDVSTIQNGDPQAQAATLVVATGVTSSAIIDGFQILGASSSNATTLGVAMSGTASPLLSNDVITGGGGNGGSNTTGSIGVSLTSGSAEITACEISGGAGSGNVGSVGVIVAGTATPLIHNDIVGGGTGTTSMVTATSVAAVGMAIATSLQNANALSGVFVQGTDKSIQGTSVGLLIGGTAGSATSAVAVDVVASVLGGGTGSGPGTVSVGVEIVQQGSAVRLLDDRIYGGQRTGGSSQTLGVFASAAGAVTIDNCEIHAGDVDSADGSVASGVSLQAASSLTLQYDTIYSGPGIGSGLSLASGIPSVSVTNDLFAGSGPADTGPAIQVGACIGQLQTLDHTAFVNYSALYACGPNNSTTATSVSQLSFDLTGTPTTGNIEIASAQSCDAGSCVPDPSCPGAAGTCLATIFGASWTSDDGYTGLLDGAPTTGDAGATFQGWTLAPGTPCQLARGGTAQGGITTDLFGQTRSTASPTIGAYEYTASNCAN